VVPTSPSTTRRIDGTDIMRLSRSETKANTLSTGTRISMPRLVVEVVILAPSGR
jgi:hypothetical protein